MLSWKFPASLIKVALLDFNLFNWFNFSCTTFGSPSNWIEVSSLAIESPVDRKKFSTCGDFIPFWDIVFAK